jgi:hypothetical protein
MYGLIHNSARSMVIAEMGEAAWDQVARRADLSDEEFLSLKSYEDAVMHRMLGAVCEVSGVTLDALLYRFGQFFITHTAYAHYGGVLSQHGSTLWELLANLNHMHDRMTSSFPDYLPPSFAVSPVSPGVHELVYSSERQGLTRFVEGLIDAMAAHFSIKLSITVLEEVRMETGQVTRFLLREESADG